MRRERTEMRRRVFVLPRSQDLVDSALTDVHKHVSVCKTLHRAHLVPLHGGNKTIEGFTAVILFQDLPISYWRNTIVVEFEPPCLAIGLDQSEVVTTMEVTRVNEDTVQLVDPGWRLVRRLVEELSEVNLEGKFVTIIDLCAHISSIPNRVNESTYLDHRVTLNVVLEPLELEVKHRRERLENDTLLCFLETIPLSHVLVLAFQGLYSNIVLEGLV